MAKRKVRLGSTHFFTLVVLSVAALGVLFTANFALQQKTNTESEAACSSSPTLTLTNTEGYRNNIRYNLRVKNNCDGWKAYKFRVIKKPTQPRVLNSWIYYFEGNTANKEFLRSGVKPYGVANVEFTVVRGYNEPPGTYKYFVVEASQNNKPWLKDTVNLQYIIERF